MSTLSDLLGLDEADLNWEELAVCNNAEIDPELFFDIYEADVVSAMATDQLCLHCPVATVCYSVGEETGSWGVWGGIYLTSGRPDAAKNAHKTPEIWKALKRKHGQVLDV
jgi:hypothetical protein